MIPGGGWLAAFVNVDLPGVIFTEPVVGWVTIGGEVTGVIVDWRRRRIVRDAPDYAEFLGYLMPDDVEAMEMLEEPALDLARRLREERGMPPVDGAQQ